MQDQSGGGLINALDAMFGGAATSMIAALFGRLVSHSDEVRKHRRKFIGVELLWEGPTAVIMAIGGEALSDFLKLEHSVSIGVIAICSYLGPRGVQAMVETWFANRIGK
jgi:hypothetical protein